MLGGFCAGFLYQLSFKERAADEIQGVELSNKSRISP